MLAITYQGEENLPTAERLAKQYSLMLLPAHQACDYQGLIVLVSSEYVGLLQGPTQIYRSHPFYIDFFTGKLAYRAAQAGLRSELLARAIGYKPKEEPFIVDATAGLGRDSFVLASLGFRVTMLERSPVASLLMQDALKRAAAHSSLATLIEKMTYISTDALTWLPAQTNPRPDVIYLDPMFPERKKSAAVKKEMVLLQELIGADEDSEQLFKLALTCASNRVVVKRPRLADNLTTMKPSFSLTGKSSRFDVYVCK